MIDNSLAYAPALQMNGSFKLIAIKDKNDLIEGVFCMITVKKTCVHCTVGMDTERTRVQKKRKIERVK